MLINIPRRYAIGSTYSAYFPHPYRTSGIHRYFVPVYFECGEENYDVSFFEDTDGRKINNCCHSFPCDSLGKTTIPNWTYFNGSYYFHYHSYGEYRNSISGAATGRYLTVAKAYPGFTIAIKAGWATANYRTLDLRRGQIQISVRRGKMISTASSNNARQWNGVFSAEVALDKGDIQYHVTRNTAGLPNIGWVGPNPKQGIFVGSKDEHHKVCESFERKMISDAEPWAHALASYLLARPDSSGSLVTASKVNGTIDQFPDPERAFMFAEPGVIMDGNDPLIYGSGFNTNSYWRNWLVQHSYVDALQSAPKLNDNSISNALEIFSFIKTLVVDHRIEIPKRLGDAWLSYRYRYSTSKYDAEEAIKFMKRHYNLSGSEGVKCYGMSSWSFDDGTVVNCRCGLTLKSRALDTIDRVWRALYTYGLQPNFYVVWDMIPYSFIVDWFIPIGDIASVLDTEANMLRGQYDIKDVCFSLSYDRVVDDYSYHCYTRWASPALSALNEFYWFDKPKSSSKVTSYRILDAASLLIGK